MTDFDPAASQTNMPTEPVGWAWRGGLLLLWAVAGFGTLFFASDLERLTVWGWPLGYWLGAQGVIVLYVLITAFYAWLANRRERQLQHDFSQHDK